MEVTKAYHLILQNGVGWCTWRRGGGEISVCSKAEHCARDTLTHCNPEMKMREDGGDFIDFDCFKFFFDERMLI